MFRRRGCIWRYLVVFSFLLYVGAFAVFLSLLDIWGSSSVYDIYSSTASPGGGGAGRMEDVVRLSRELLLQGNASQPLVGGDSGGLPLLRTTKPADGKLNIIPDSERELGLQGLRPNMTLLKANMSGFADMVRLAAPGGDSKVNAKGGVSDATRSPSFDVSSLDSVKQVNPHPFRVLLEPMNPCGGQDIFLLIYVHTAVANFRRRMIIRQTWGDRTQYVSVAAVRLIFVLGLDTSGSSQASLQFESEQYGDLLQENFADTYRNLTFKGIAALRWIEVQCSHAHYVLKTDDDIFVNGFTLLRHLRSLDRYAENRQHLLLCLVWYGMPVMREGKWGISVEDWPNSTYPTYCSGCAFTMSTDVAVAMHRVSYHVKFFWVDDFYITGLLPLRLGSDVVRHRQFMSTYILDGRRLAEKFNGPQWYTYVFSHVHDLDAIQTVWTKLVRLASGAEHANIQFVQPTVKTKR